MTVATNIGGRVPGTTAEIREHVREAVGRRRPVRIAGGGTWLDANRPVTAEETLSTRGLTGIVEYVPGDLTLTARAGTTLAEIARVSAAHRQWFALDPIGDSTRATIGATIATSSYGPLAHHFGTARDMTLGVEFVSGAGEVVRGGGRVVKNVAGFDLTRLVTGSWGTLGVITEVSVRLRALPALESTLAIDLGTDLEAVERARAALRRLPFMPLAAQVLSSTLADATGVGARGNALLLRIGGNAEAMSAQRRQLAALGDVREHPAACWETLRSPEPRDTAVVRLSRVASRFADTWREALALVEPQKGYCHGDPGRGVVRCVLPIADDDDARPLRTWLGALYQGARIIERLPHRLWPLAPPFSSNARLSREIKRAFDPAHILNPGIFGDHS